MDRTKKVNAGEVATSVAGLWSAAVRSARFLSPHVSRVPVIAACAALFAAASAAEPLLLARLFDEIAGGRGVGVLIGCLAGWIGLAMASAFAVRRRDVLSARVAAEVGRDLRRRLADSELRAVGPYESCLEVSAVSGVEGVTTTLATLLPTLISELAALTIGALVAWLLDWRIALVMVAAVGPAAWLNLRLSARLQRASAAYAVGIGQLAEESRRFFHPAGRELVTAMRARPHVLSRVATIADVLRDADERRFVAGNYYPATKLAGTVLGVVVVGVAVLCSDLSFGEQVGFLTLARQQLAQLLILVVTFGAFANQIAHVQVVEDALAVPTERENGRRVEAPQGRLEIRDVSAIYPDGRRGLHRLTLAVAPGEAVAIVGGSGVGKTTITRLATGSATLFLQRGEARLDGEPLSCLELDFLRETIVGLPAVPWIFPATVAENLLPPAGAGPEDLEWACRLTRLHGEIGAWPKGYDTWIDRDSVSSGQAQRLGVARALLRTRFGSARMMVLDEPTAALDPCAAEGLLDSVLSFLEAAGITAVVITHRLPVHPRITRVVSIDEGRVIEDGDPRVLAADLTSAYARLLMGRDR